MMTTTASPESPEARLSRAARERASEAYMPAGLGNWLANPFDEVHNAAGIVNLSTAENMAAAPLVHARLALAQASFPLQWMRYNAMHGTAELRGAICRHMERTAGAPSTLHLNADDVIVGSGVSGCLNMLSWCLLDEGDVVLHSAPYYSAFDVDLCLLSGSRNVTVPDSLVDRQCHDGASASSSTRSLELTPAPFTAWKTAIATTDNAQAVLLTNPGNPQGCFLSLQWMSQLMRHVVGACGLHLIVDEIYADSMFRPLSGSTSASAGEAGEDAADAQWQGDAYVSAFTVLDHVVASAANGQTIAETAALRSYYEQRVHVVSGISKDFGCSGLRLGFIYTKNKRLHSALSRLSIGCSVSLQSQWAFTQILNDDDWMATFRAQRNQRVQEAYDYVCEQLDAAQVSYFRHTNAALYVIVDLRSLLSRMSDAVVGNDDVSGEAASSTTTSDGGDAVVADAWACEHRLMMTFVEAGVLIIPGKSFYFPEAGFFRIIFTHPNSHLHPGMERFVSVVKRLRGQ